ncbi:threonine synthase [uncultured Acetobacteroides sp.]|uniref:threonine synthase n=1 Tax=uncultured Acetobacteroides sp. TaxID=1760811 RepID=UPI0029F52D74|nr:threonine synthase [uncultured Acetobacteroides sp.]
MKYYSTNRQSALVDFREATIEGLAPDKGLYFPESIPQVDPDLIKNIKSYSNVDIAFSVMRPYVEGALPDGELQRIVAESISYEFPLVAINDRIASLELFHGPTFAFKDLGARFMSRCLGYFAQDASQKMTVLVATSGDTGGAVANGFFNVPGVEVVILYPSGKVSNVQEKQLTTLGHNVYALEVQGNFDDCQRMVKEAFADTALRGQRFLTSANSINVARWLPQQLFYFFAYKQWKDNGEAPVVSVPSGNFGNICSGMLANLSGLPIKKFVVACNANDAVPEYLLSGKYNPKETISTISNAMDVGNPSNFVRILELYKNSYEQLRQRMAGYSISDEVTRDTIRSVSDRYGYWLDPHGAVAYRALEQYLAEHPAESGLILETAHPVKFDSDVEVHQPLPTELAQQVAALVASPKQSTIIGPSYEALKALLLENR